MSHLEQLEDKIQHTFTSGQPGTTGREPFEEDRGESNPFHRPDHKHEGTHNIGTGSDLIGRSSTGTGNERDINAGGGQQHQHNLGSGLTGGAAGQGYDGNNRTGEHHHQHSGQNAGLGQTGRAYDCGQIGEDHASHRHGHHDNDGVNYPTTGSGMGSGGTAGGAGITAGTHGFQHQGGNSGQGVTGAFENDARREVGSHGGHHTGSGLTGSDKVGNLGQNSADYERTGAGGPISGGAAGTDRFDSDRHHNTGATGRHTGESIENQTGTGGNGGNSASFGGALGSLGTSNDEFIGKDRRSGGAYADTEGTFKNNTSGPGGNTALTGREGTTDQNPVAQAKSAGHEVGSGPTGATSAHTGTGAEGVEPHKKGIVEKIKDML
ncbi:uncharacterized protein IL334_003088 [Kwoniella shivajii]|uniref:Dehydrin n=1 Tax=Kwoniella shivajii TaxID=564305 RepID=A0ABZ1CWW9_9TREE|nr:hypothetical protein IL334_003088 [Kwoniella shivajii]